MAPAPPVAVVAVPLGSRPFTHDGFYLCLGLGGAFTSAIHHTNTGHDVTVLAGSADISAAAGWSVAKNAAIFGTLCVSGMGSPTVKVNGATMNTAGASGAFGGVGVGSAYFIEPINVDVSATLGAMAFRLADANDQTIYGTNLGLGFQAMVGKEWWVTPQWEAGIAVDLKTAYLYHGSDSLPWSVGSAGLVLSLTCN